MDAFSKYHNVKKSDLKEKFGEKLDNELDSFVFSHAESVYQFANLDETKISTQAKQIKSSSEKNPEKIYTLQRDQYEDWYIKNGKRILFYSDRLLKFGDTIAPGELLTDLWFDVLPNDLHNEGGVSLRKGKKPEKLIQRIFELFTNEKEFVLDYFVGSGTSSAAALKMGRRFIGIDSENYFDNLAITRLKNTLNGDSSGISKQFNWKGGGCFKYLTLEQYEDTLNNINFMEGGTVQKTLMDMDGYVLRYMLDFETRESLCRMNTTKLERPFEYTLRITKDSEMHDETVDLVETFNYLLGLKVKRVLTFAENGTTYRVVHGETLAGQATTVIWRTTAGLDLKADKTFIEAKVLTDPKLKAERVFINGDFHVEGALHIEPEFQRLMGA